MGMSPLSMRRVLAILVLVVLAGCGGPLAGGTSPAPPSSTATPAPIPTTQAPTYPPGVGQETLNATRLATVTARTLNGSTYALTADQLEGVPDQSLTTTFVGPRTQLRVAAPDRYLWTNATVSVRGSGLAIERFENATYATGTRLLRYDGTNTTSRPLTRSDVDPGSRFAAALIARFLAASSVEVTRLSNGSVAVAGRGSDRSDRQDYSLQALIASDGTVLRFRAVYAQDDGIRLVRFRLDRDASFEPPAWASNATRSTTTPTPEDDTE